VALLAAQLARLAAPEVVALVVDRTTGRVVGGDPERSWRLSA
jgi:hypothetical protein